VQAAAVLGQAPTVPEGEVQFFVCYLKPEDNPIYTFIVEIEAEEEEDDSPSDEESTTTTTPSTEAALPIPAGTYEGTFDETRIMLFTYADYTGATVNEIAIAIDALGKVTGGASIHFDGDAFFGCPAHDRWTFTIDEGQQIDTDLPTTVAVTLRSESMRTTPYSGAGCTDQRNGWDDMDVDILSFNGYSDGVIAGEFVYEGFSFGVSLIESE